MQTSFNKRTTHKQYYLLSLSVTDALQESHHRQVLWTAIPLNAAGLFCSTHQHRRWFNRTVMYESIYSKAVRNASTYLEVGIYVEMFITGSSTLKDEGRNKVKF
ncbi:MAG: hypothetical protein EHM64_06580 [Ignavibacteriae bacterium]|nr:MAG: hypothetical protein EHM64_06580 [Ignavibacteriota bacterium]